MTPNLKCQALRTIVNKEAKELCKAAYKLKVSDNLVAARKT